MLHSVPMAINRAARQVVLRNPNAFKLYALRRTVNRVEIDPATGQPNESGGSPTLGGMTVLRAEDEADISYSELGEGRMLFVDGVPEPADVNDANAGLLGASSRMARIESMVDQTEPGFFEAAQGDLLVIDMGMGASLVYEVVTLSSRCHIPPYNRIVIVNLRDDLDNQNPPYPLPSAPAQPPAGGAGSGTENGTPPSGDEPLTPEPAPDGGDSGTSSGGTEPQNVPSDPWAGL